MIDKDSRRWRAKYSGLRFIPLRGYLKSDRAIVPHIYLESGEWKVLRPLATSPMFYAILTHSTFQGALDTVKILHNIRLSNESACTKEPSHLQRFMSYLKNRCQS